MKTPNLIVLTLIACLVGMIMVPNVSAALSVTVSQSGADSDEVMKDGTFIIEAAGWSGSCSTGTISFANCPSCSLSGEETSKSIGGEATSISWTTVSSSSTASAQTVSVSVTSGCTLQQATSSNFDIVLPPSLSLSASTTASSVAAGGSFVTNLNVVNNGGTTAQSVSISVASPFSASCSSISSINEGQSASESCTVTAPSTSGGKTATFTATASNAGSDSDSFSITVTGGSGGDDTSGSSSSGGTGVPSDDVSEIINIGVIDAGATGTALFTEPRLALTEVKITSKDAVSNVVVNSLQTATMPTSVTVPVGTIYGYLTISALNIENENISSASIKFRVNKTWLSSNGVDQSDIILRRFNNNAWDDLSTSVVSSDTDYVYFTSTTPGFSVFVITTKAAAQPDTGGQTNGTDATCITGQRRCSSISNQLQQCSADGMTWDIIETCQYGCDSSINQCNTEDTGSGTGAPMDELPLMWIIVIVIIIVVVIIAVVVFKKQVSS